MKFKVIRQTVLIDASPAETYEAYVDPVKHAEFTGSPATGSARVGGRFTAWGGYISGKFLELERGKRVVQEWRTTEWPAGYPASVVELTFAPKGKKTQLTMVHSKVPAEQAAAYADGWFESYWDPMNKHFRER